MAADILPRNLVARRTLSTGGIVGLSIGMAIVAALLFLLALPFILRARRDAKARRHESILADEMDMAGADGPVAATVSPLSHRRMPTAPVTQPLQDMVGAISRPVKEYDVDGGSYEDTLVAPIPIQAPPAASAPSPHPDVPGSVLASYPEHAVVRTDSPAAMEGPSAVSQAAAGAVPPAPGPVLARSESSWNRKSSKGSLSQAIEELAGKATAAFRRTSTRSERSIPTTSPTTRAPTFDMIEDETLAPALSAPPQLFPDEDHTTGAAAEYYSNLPMSPPELEDLSPTLPASYSQPGAGGPVTTSLVSMTAFGALAGVRFQPKRTDSGHTDFSPLSPVSPPIKLEHSFEEEEPVADMSRGQDADRLAVGPDPSEEDEEDGEKPKIKVEFPASPKRSIIPSPALPAPGTGNPMDLWRPLNDDELSHLVAAEIDRIEKSPTPGPSEIWRDSTPASNADGRLTPTYTPRSPHTPSPGPTAPPITPSITEPTLYPPSEEMDEDTSAEMDDTFTPRPESGEFDRPSFDRTPITNPGSGSDFGPSPSPGPQYGLAPVSSSNSFSCEECGRVFDQVHKLNHHKRYHERPHVCTQADCGKRFGTKTHLDRHINDKHKKTRKYHCTEPGCPYSKTGGKSFPRKDNWRRHMQNKHNLTPTHDPIEVIDEPMVES